MTDRAMRAVLSLLVANAGRAVRAETLLDAAWEKHELPRNALDSLDTRITRLRTLLAPEAELSWTVGGCVLTVAPENVDAARFERMVEAARWCSDHEAVSILDRALSLWQGDPLPDLHRHGQEHPECVRLRQLRARAVEDLASRELEIGAVEDAAGRLLSLLSTEPLRERACGDAMRALHRLDMTSDAASCYEQLVERLADELGEGPSTRLREIYRAVTGREPNPAASPAGRPVESSFIGRGHELARLSTMLEKDRLVSVIGPAGTGKTRLLREALSSTDTPSTVVRLAGCEQAELYETVATALGVHSRGRDDASDDLPTVLAEYLRGRRHILVLDSCEQLLTTVRTMVRRLSARCQELTVVTTSKVRLGLAGERVLPLGPLARDGVRDPLLSRAGRLFLDRAQRLRPDFPRDDEERDLARSLLRRVDCLPLTVELLAARVAADDWTTPEPWPTDIAEWSFGELSTPEQDLLGSLTVFGGHLDNAAAAAVVDAADGAADDAADDVADPLTALSQTGLLTATASTQDPRPRYRMPDLVRRLATRRFADTEVRHKARQRHALWCADLLANAVAEDDELAAFSRLREAEDDVCAALRWAMPEAPALAAELTGQIGLLTTYRPRARLLPWQLGVARATDSRLSRHSLAAASGADAAVRCGLAEEGLRLAARAAELATTPEHRHRAVHTLIRAYYDLDDERTVTVCHELLGLNGVADSACADAHAFLSLVASGHGYRHEALHNAEAALDYARASSSACSTALATYAAGRSQLLTDLSEGATLLAKARAQAKTARAGWIEASAGTALADALLTLGRVPEAAKLLQLTLDDWHRMRAPRQLRAGVDVALRCLASAGDRSKAETLVQHEAERSTSENLVIARSARSVARALADVYGG